MAVDILSPCDDVENGHKINEDPSKPKLKSKKHDRNTEERLDKITVSNKLTRGS